MQSEAEVEPMFGLYVPAGQSKHLLEAEEGYVPGPHGEQKADPATLKLPAGHEMQLLSEVEPASGLNVFTGH